MVLFKYQVPISLLASVIRSKQIHLYSFPADESDVDTQMDQAIPRGVTIVHQSDRLISALAQILILTEREYSL